MQLFFILKCSLLPWWQDALTYPNQEVPAWRLSKILYLSNLLQSRFLVICGIINKKGPIFPIFLFFSYLYMEPNKVCGNRDSVGHGLSVVTINLLNASEETTQQSTESEVPKSWAWERHGMVAIVCFCCFLSLHLANSLKGSQNWAERGQTPNPCLRRCLTGTGEADSLGHLCPDIHQLKKQAGALIWVLSC